MWLPPRREHQLRRRLPCQRSSGKCLGVHLETAKEIVGIAAEKQLFLCSAGNRAHARLYTCFPRTFRLITTAIRCSCFIGFISFFFPHISVLNHDVQSYLCYAVSAVHFAPILLKAFFVLVSTTAWAYIVVTPQRITILVVFFVRLLNVSQGECDNIFLQKWAHVARLECTWLAAQAYYTTYRNS